jgi:hypothetical protein
MQRKPHKHWRKLLGAQNYLSSGEAARPNTCLVDQRQFSPYSFSFLPKLLIAVVGTLIGIRL